jgi:uncharacterized protein
MPGPALILREVHRLRKHAKELQDEIERAPRQLRAQAAKVAAQENALKEGQEALKMLKVSAHEKESQVKGVQQTIAKHEKQKNEATSKKEYDAFNVEIASEKKKISELEDEILEALTKIDEQAARIPEFDKALQQARKAYADFEESIKGRADGLRQEMEKTLEQIGEVEARLPTEVTFRSTYNRIVASMKDDALAGVRGRTCTACYTDITAQNLHDLHQEMFVMCKSCGRALYVLE